MYAGGPNNQTTWTVRGTIQAMDLLSRELRLVVNGASEEVAVPPGCAVWLHQERVKLRLLQPQDSVEVVCRRARGLALAQSVRVLGAEALPEPAAAAQAAGGGRQSSSSTFAPTVMRTV
jgi:hypothetical protein